MLKHTLEAISMNGQQYKLAFQGPFGRLVEVQADILILTLPFSVLRNIPFRVELPEHKQKAIG